ncbi:MULTISPECIES: hypothetical protein [unclassified Streptomyces]|uniref:hypothetical protein n=1 Tax=unclassified Streptomyces TaxID=2593676 RepID=UPI002E0E164E|nr:hypothetical protein OG466_41035 [Streptomyces sp. NBC_01240]
MNDFQPMRTSEEATADRPWLASLVGVHDANTITLDLTKFVAGVHYEAGTLLQPRNVLKSGLPLGKIKATGLYAPYAGPTSEVQTVTVTGAPTGGTYTLTFSGQTTAAIPFNATAAQVKTALENLSNINAGDLTVTGGPHPGTAMAVTFGGQFMGNDVAAMTASGTGLTGGTTPGVTIATATAGGTATATDGTQTLAGFLASESMFAPGSTKTSGALLWYGEVFADKCPIPFDPTDVASVAPGVNIHYR